MRTKLARWGNSAGVRLPKSLLAELGVGADAEFETWVKGGELHMRPVTRATRYRLDVLLDAITPDNVPPLEDWPAVGAEVIEDDYSRLR